jgi:ABC-type transporter Mla MlaB component
MMTQDTEAGARLVLEGALTMRTVDAVRATMREAIERAVANQESAAPGSRAPAIVIDCAAAEEIDLTFIQLLIAARLSARGRNRTVILASAPDGALLDTLTRGGFQPVRESDAADIPAYWFEQASA